MNSEQVNLRFEPDLVAAVERIALEESLDRATVIRRLLRRSISDWELERAVQAYQRGEASLGRAAELCGLTQWELLDAARARGVAYPLEPGDVGERVAMLGDDGSAPGAPGQVTLPDHPPAPGGILLVGVNPAPPSVAAGHYYQGKLGRRLWQRLEALDLMDSPLPGAEDEAWVRAGHGLTDVVKRPTPAASELRSEELREGADSLREKVAAWRPGLVLFAFQAAARAALGERRIAAGSGPALAGVATFLLSGPFAPRAERARVDRELRELLRRR
jgi:TDG/mug DNA glycosylase family protein